MQLRLCQAGPGFWPGPLVPAEVAPATAPVGLENRGTELQEPLSGISDPQTVEESAASPELASLNPENRGI